MSSPEQEYTGDVDASGPAAVRRLSGLTVRKMSVGPMDNNAYLLTDEDTGEALLVDAANDADRLFTLLDGVDLRTILTTHQHGDHWQALQQVAGATGARTSAHPLDADALPVTPDVLVEDGDVLQLGSRQLHVIHLRGHTPGSVALLWQEDSGPHLFTGDSLFPGGPGNTFGDADAHRQLVDDLEARVFDRLPDDTWVYPGHGSDTTLGAERPSLPEWRARGW